jgi:hypothetical protein
MAFKLQEAVEREFAKNCATGGQQPLRSLARTGQFKQRSADRVPLAPVDRSVDSVLTNPDGEGESIFDPRRRSDSGRIMLA